MNPKLLLGLALVVSGALSSAAQARFEYITTNGQVTITAHISDDKSVIIPDMAGVQMSDSKKAKCTFYRRHSIGGIPASTGIEHVADGARITTTVDYDSKTQRVPANFWADIRKDSDIAEFMVIVTTYKPKSNNQ